ncbi:MAG: AmmeMemoRadiSam system radical SAM enzyme [Bacteroidales bacterium]|jgi:pyruvate formate lyase activating enzyme|nr:AmmeMemoRadiSam system radical SAM enzyme [Bacteroidales bacterium]
MKASFYNSLENDAVQCVLCPHECRLDPGKTGICRVRTNTDGILMSDNYGKLCSLHLDPIEKKPLYHYHPGRNILSVGSVGCNLHCRFCQNWEISQTAVKDYPYLNEYTPGSIVDLALEEKDNLGIAYTYNEPTVWYEYMLDIARLAAGKGLKNVMVTNGFINTEPLRELMPVMHAFSVDLKAFTENFYRRLTSSSLAPVLESLKTIREHGRHLEITNLLIPDQNDDEKDFRRMLEWIQKELGKETVLHISRFFPTYKLIHNSTPEALLLKFYDIAREYLDFVYLGNLHSDRGKDTLCPECSHLLISRTGYRTSLKGLDEHGKCEKCGAAAGIAL